MTSVMNADQAAAFAAVQSGKNIFLTGPAGAGKSFLIREIVDWAEKNGIRASVTALTGCAALLLGPKAKTLHSWAGIGLGRESADELTKRILKKPYAKSKWKKTQLLIIDEISMMTPELFEKLDAIGKKVRASSKPWGGIQLVICGDFLQLPPVTRGISGEMAIPGRFAFESAVWKASNLTPILLTKIERQTDAGFQKLLNECRIGELSAESIALLKSRQGLDWKSQLIRPTLLFSRNADVDAINEKNIAALKKPIRVYNAFTDVVTSPEYADVEVPTGELLTQFETRLDNDANYCPTLELCVGCQVMLLINKDIEAGLVNGSRGVVIDFAENGNPIVQFLHGDPVMIEANSWQSNDCPILHRKQIPLRVAYAITIHKSQGATLDCALVDIGSSTFEYGQAYVALSRVRDINSLYVWNLEPSKIRAHPTVISFYQSLMESAPDHSSTESPADATVHSSFGADLTADWHPYVQRWAASDVGSRCLATVDERSKAVSVYPPAEERLNALKYTPLADVRVVILGQDPYHGEGQAHGLSFSVKPGVSLPPSLKNIRKELILDVGLGNAAAWPEEQGNLTSWASRGVLLLNAVLSVEQGNANSHSGIGWEDLTSQLLSAVVATNYEKPLVFIAWGKFAQNIIYKLKLNPAKHKVLASAHPSPLSAHNGFFGSKPFSKANEFLVSAGSEPIVWNLVSSEVTEDPK